MTTAASSILSGHHCERYEDHGGGLQGRGGAGGGAGGDRPGLSEGGTVRSESVRERGILYGSVERVSVHVSQTVPRTVVPVQ